LCGDCNLVRVVERFELSGQGEGCAGAAASPERVHGTTAVYVASLGISTRPPKYVRVSSSVEATIVATVPE
jgi:hypothetical protein